MTYDVEFTDEFRDWFEVDLSLSEQESVTRVVDMLQDASAVSVLLGNRWIKVFNHA